MKLTIGILYGSRSCEHDVSIISASQAAQAAEKAGFDVVRVYLARDGGWYVGPALESMEFYRNFDPSKVTRVLPAPEKGKLMLLKYPEDRRAILGRGREVLRTVDVVLPVFHGMNGEDGTIQGMLELMDVPYTSCGVLSSAVGMDKICMKQIFRANGFPVVEDLWLERAAWQGDPQGCIERVESALHYPVFVKPANLGSSIGISRADDRDGLIHALNVACSFDRRILVERGVTGLKEVNCGVLGYADDVTVSVLEMPASWHEFLDFDDKYLSGGKQSKGMQSLSRRIPAPISEEKTREVQDLARRIFRALDCRGVVRIDFLLEGEREDVYVGEINTIPGSLAFYLFEKMGISFPDLIEKMVELAYRAYADRHESVFTYDSRILSRQGGVKGAKGGKA